MLMPCILAIVATIAYFSVGLLVTIFLINHGSDEEYSAIMGAFWVGTVPWMTINKAIRRPRRNR